MPEVSWSKAGERLPAGALQQGSVLTVPAAAITDRGLYVCRATNAAGTAQASAVVEVEREYRQSAAGPRCRPPAW